MEKHFTVSVYIVSRINGVEKILLHKHKKLNMWLPVGGHIDFGETPIDAAVREAKEESDLDIEITTPITPIALMEQTIPQYNGKPVHKHLDSVYIATTNHPEKAKMAEEFGWFSKGELRKMDIKEDVRLLSDIVFSRVN